MYYVSKFCLHVSLLSNKIIVFIENIVLLRCLQLQLKMELAIK